MIQDNGLIMANVIIVGAQWGDEGKGKVVDLLTERADIVVRFQGGHNAGHTLVINGRKYVLHLVPSGIMHPGKVCLLGNGMVVSLEALLAEIQELHALGVTISEANLKVSSQAQVIMPYHRELDMAREKLKGPSKIGTTGRGIGPAYEDKVARRGIRVGDLANQPLFENKLRENLAYHNFVLEKFYQAATFNFESLRDESLRLAEQLLPLLEDTGRYLATAMAAGKSVLFEGAQGTLLDVDHGTYPFVTSSSTVAGGACTGSGVGPKTIDAVIGITKAYTTRVGSGPFPTELHDAVGEHLARVGHEFGATTGRARRCGWFDAVAMRHAARINGLTGLAVTKLDVLDGLEKIKVGVGYMRNGQRMDYLPDDPTALENCQPVYEELTGWSESTAGITEFDRLPQAAQAYVRHLESLVGVKAVIVSTGPDRDHTIILSNPFDS